eukprot:6199356-Pleurochrysis_carterae.AAC.4
MEAQNDEARTLGKRDNVRNKQPASAVISITHHSQLVPRASPSNAAGIGAGARACGTHMAARLRPRRSERAHLAQQLRARALCLAQTRALLPDGAKAARAAQRLGQRCTLRRHHRPKTRRAKPARTHAGTQARTHARTHVRTHAQAHALTRTDMLSRTQADAHAHARTCGARLQGEQSGRQKERCAVINVRVAEFKWARGRHKQDTSCRGMKLSIVLTCEQRASQGGRQRGEGANRQGTVRGEVCASASASAYKKRK